MARESLCFYVQIVGAGIRSEVSREGSRNTLFSTWNILQEHGILSKKGRFFESPLHRDCRPQLC